MDTEYLPPRDHNKPPGDDLLASLHASQDNLQARQHTLLDSFRKRPKVIGTATAGSVADLAKMLSTSIAMAEEQRKLWKQPYLSGGRMVDHFFAELTGPLETAKGQLLGELADYATFDSAVPLRGDYGSVVVVTEEIIPTVNCALVDLEALRQFLAPEAIEKAVRAAARAGIENVRGVTYTRKLKATVR